MATKKRYGNMYVLSARATGYRNYDVIKKPNASTRDHSARNVRALTKREAEILKAKLRDKYKDLRAVKVKNVPYKKFYTRVSR